MAAAPQVLTVNAGSSSLKLSIAPPSPHNRLRGLFEKIGSEEANWSLELADGQSIRGRGTLSKVSDTLPVVDDWLKRHDQPLSAIAYRIVHGGPEFVEHCPITDDVLAALHRAGPLAPEHLPGELALIQAFRRAHPRVAHIACFDTAFHASLPPAAKTLPLPQRIRDAGVHRFGFHGLSYESLRRRLQHQNQTDGRSVWAHLGNGASMAAVWNGVCQDTTMGFTPAGGLVMSSRCGDIDPGIFRFLQTELDLDADQIDRLVNHESGMLGLSGISGDVRDLLAASAAQPGAALALEIFCRSAKKNLCALAGILGGLDRIVFTGGIGEHSPEIRAGILSGLEFLGIQLDATANQQSQPVISSSHSQVPILVIPADEEAAMTEIAFGLLNHTKPTDHP